VSRPNGYLE